MLLYRISIHYQGGSKPISWKKSEVTALGLDDVAARASAIQWWQKDYKKYEGVAAPKVQYCEVELVSRVDVY